MTDGPGRDCIVRAPNHLGDVVLALPALAAARADVMVVRPLVPVLRMAGLQGHVLPLDRGAAGFARAVRTLRSRGYRRGTLLSAAFSAAWLFRCGGVRHLRGTRTDGRGFLLRERIEPEELLGRHRSEAFLRVVGEEGTESAAPRTVIPPREHVEGWRQRLGGGPDDVTRVAIFPGANAPARRWPVERFTEAAAELAGRGYRVVALGGPGERQLTAKVAAAAAGAHDLGGATDVVDLAAVLSLCDLVVTNDTGPMHLAGAVGTPTVSLWGSSDPNEVRQRGSVDTPVQGAELPCRPCRRNHCSRRGAGTLLADAHVECMRLIDVRDVVDGAQAALTRGRHRE
jgi:heptosyltransferase-2